MDAKTLDLVSSRLIGHGGLLRAHGTTVIVATHSCGFDHHPVTHRHSACPTNVDDIARIMSAADTIITIEKGSITGIGSPTTVLQNKSYNSKAELALVSSNNEVETINADAADDVSALGASDPTNIGEVVDNIPYDLRRKNGDFSVYQYYLRSAGTVPVSLYMLGVLVWIFCSEFSSQSATKLPPSCPCYEC